MSYITNADTLDGSHAANTAGNVPVLDGGGKLLDTVLNGLLQKYTISDALLHSHDGVSSTNAAGYTQCKVITLNTLSPTPSTLRIKFDLKTTNVSATAYGKLYKGVTPVGTERTNGTTDYVTFSEDLVYADGDTLCLYCHSDGDVSLQFRNLRIYGDVQITLADAIVDGSVGVADAFDASNTY